MSYSDLVGFVGLGLNLYSFYTKGEFRLRLFSSIANVVYVIYGVLIFAMPIIVGSSIAVLLHLNRLTTLKINQHDSNKTSD